MTRLSVPALCLILWAGSPAIAAPAASTAPAALSAEQVVEKNIAARGGLAAWRAVKTLTLEGQLDAGGKPAHQLPFVLKMKRPRKSRLEIMFKEQTSIQVYDGTQGWKVRPYLNRTDVEPFTPAEAKAAAASEELDGPLVDYAAKGTQIALAGTEKVEGRPAYKLKLTRRDGPVRHLWIDATTFLEVKMDGTPRKLDGHLHNVAIYFRDYKVEHGLAIARLEETAVEGVKERYQRTITRVAVNEAMDDALFAKPQPAPAAATAPKTP